MHCTALATDCLVYVLFRLLSRLRVRIFIWGNTPKLTCSLRYDAAVKYRITITIAQDILHSVHQPALRVALARAAGGSSVQVSRPNARSCLHDTREAIYWYTTRAKQSIGNIPKQADVRSRSTESTTIFGGKNWRQSGSSILGSMVCTGSIWAPPCHRISSSTGFRREDTQIHPAKSQERDY